MADQHDGRSRGLRIVLAYDLSAAGERAVALIAGSAWPDGTTVRVLTSPLGIGAGLSSLALLSEARAHAKQVRATIEHAHERVSSELSAAGVAVETRIVHGRPERALVADADASDADLLVVGARDHGPVSATLLGSVSRAVVGEAPCSVLVARGSAISRVLLATDGSEAARLATAMVAAWPLFAGVRALVVGVGSPAPRYPGVALGGRPDSSAYPDAIDDALDRSTAAVYAAVGELGGRSVEHEVRLGDEATEIVAAARAWAADVVALGASSEPFLRRMLLGSVARTVLEGVRASVLIARPRPTQPTGRTATADASSSG
jgi:nucleotide-binding universal stress UspA family protein